MGILSDILGSLAVGVVKVAIAGGGALARIGARIATEAKPRIIAAIIAFRDEWERRQANRERQKVVVHPAVGEELREVNEKLARLGQKAASQGLNQREQGFKEELVLRRNQLMVEIQNADEFRIAKGIAEAESEYAALTITDSTTHLLQSTVGQTLYGKKCPKCGWQMQVQWDRSKSSVDANQLGWGCTGWYWQGNGNPHRCNHWESLVKDDLDVFARAQRPEFSELNPKQFSDLVLGHTEIVINRMEDVRQDKMVRGSVEAYRCPVHGEELVLRQKKEHNGRLLDMYFLGCPRWKVQGNGCQYIVKLKSPAQLHAYLEASTGEGVI
jgi:hypothetical protein